MYPQLQQGALLAACLLVFVLEMRSPRRTATPSPPTLAPETLSPTPAPPTLAPATPAPPTSSPPTLAPGEDARCLWGAGFWCSGLPEARTCLQQTQCASLPPAVHATDNTRRFGDWRMTQRKVRRRVVEDSRGGGEGVRKPVLLMVGDSITAALSEYSSKKWERVDPEGTNMTTLLYGIGGDRTEHLLWRITRGEYEGLPPPDAVVTLIGTNNLPEGHNVADIAFGVRAVLQALQGVFPSVPVVAMSVLPRADCPQEEVASGTCKRGCFPHPANERVKGINKLVQGFAGEVGSVFLDCYSVAVNGSADSLSAANFPDHLHPSVEGYKLLWNECLLPLLQTHPDLKDRFQLP